ncbi:hypothetical protein [Kitasatospora purpeofusca]|uniref:hypothetical protein n=1 Tax=Kitasatospora purpeofusca TaxID=67352 RepID=UPI0022544BB7|nr:hypothetical protein [Kitasatospora purpeofusca]MCX4755670.1 hypothetical protein [Kitasatospora purpeofusca]WSR36468.1 hypothetical protein OG715_39245 [Kitasatospora purpeofusca]
MSPRENLRTKIGPTPLRRALAALLAAPGAAAPGRPLRSARTGAPTRAAAP